MRYGAECLCFLKALMAKYAIKWINSPLSALVDDPQEWTCLYVRFLLIAPIAGQHVLTPKRTYGSSQGFA
jgi:hypothetical protein